MAKVKITGHASGSGVITVTAPNTSTDRTITLPDATGTLATTADTTDLDGAITINESGADVDFRVESDDNANMIFVDGGNDRVGIGTATPARTLHVNSADANIASFEGHQGEGLVISSGTNGQVDIIGYDDGASAYNPIHIRSGTNGVFLHTTGAVTMPSQPSIAVTGNASGYTTVNSGSVAPFNTIETQTGGSNYNTSTYRYTAPVAGWYHVTFACLSQSSISQEWLLRKNANTIRRCFEDSDRGWSFSTQVYCAVNDYLDIESNSTNSNNIYMGSGGNAYSWVSYRLLG